MVDSMFKDKKTNLPTLQQQKKTFHFQAAPCDERNMATVWQINAQVI